MDDARTRVAKRAHRIHYYASLSGTVPERWIEDDFDDTAPQWLALADEIVKLLVRSDGDLIGGGGAAIRDEVWIPYLAACAEWGKEGA